jgi:hydroxymethylbilane synthase
LIRIGTRGSALALAQASWVAQRIPETTELVRITTAGDRESAADRAPARAEDKSRWVSELERALLDGRIDLAVHSAKDVPGELADGLELVAIPERADPRDAICGAKSLADLAPGARVGTSSLRRMAQIRALRQDLELVPIRGNIDTRLGKLADGEFEAIVLAQAGLARLGHHLTAPGPVVGILDELIPAAGQGALAVQARPGNWPLQGLSDTATTACVHAERQLTRALEASCNTPIGAYARWLPGADLELQAWVGRPDGSAWLRDRVTGPPAEVGPRCAERLLASGARELL